MYIHKKAWNIMPKSKETRLSVDTELVHGVSQLVESQTRESVKQRCKAVITSKLSAQPLFLSFDAYVK